MKTAERQFTTISGVPVEPVYGPGDLQGMDPLPGPGEFPYTRGIHRDSIAGSSMMRQSSATPEGEPTPISPSLGQGQTGLSVAFDLPT
jgi:methylmalonyl-CoA mutase N-terminal domain/subunit